MSDEEYRPPEFEWFLLRRDRITRSGQRITDWQAVSVVKGGDPLYGHGSWTQFAGPFATADEAWEADPDEDEWWEV